MISPLGHTGVWCSGNILSLAPCNEESCSSISSMSNFLYKNSNINCINDIDYLLESTIAGAWQLQVQFSYFCIYD